MLTKGLAFIPLCLYAPCNFLGINPRPLPFRNKFQKARILCSDQSLDEPRDARSWRSTLHTNPLHVEEESADNPGSQTTLYGADGDDVSGPGGGGGHSSGGAGGGDSFDAELPNDVRSALVNGLVTTEALKRYNKALENPFMKFMLAFPAFRTRFLADSAFAFKLLVQELIGNGTALASEIAVRGKDIVHELEYVASDLIVGTVIEAAFVWLLAPTVRVPLQSVGRVGQYIASLPSHIFLPSTAMQRFNLSQRAASFFYASAQYAVIGFVGGVVGTAITYGLIKTRQHFDKNYKLERPLPAVVPNSAAWGAFLALSSNTRFQLVEGMELGIARLAAGRAHSAVNAGIVALRLANNYWGGVQFVQFFRLLGLHAVASDDELYH